MTLICFPIFTMDKLNSYICVTKYESIYRNLFENIVSLKKGIYEIDRWCIETFLG